MSKRRSGQHCTDSSNLQLNATLHRTGEWQRFDKSLDSSLATPLNSTLLPGIPLPDFEPLFDELLERCDAHMCSIQLTTQQLCSVQSTLCLMRKTLERCDLLPQVIDFQGPPGLMGLFAMLRQLRDLTGATQLLLEALKVTNTGGGYRFRSCFRQEPIDTRDTSTGSETLLHHCANARAGG